MVNVAVCLKAGIDLPKLVLLIDSREKGSLPVKLKKAVPYEERALGAGDYWIPKEEGFIIIERSTYSDFIGKIISGRLWKQVEKCLSKSDDVYFLLENPYMQRFSKFSYKATVGAKTSLSRRVKIFETRNASESFVFIVKLYEKYNTDKKVDYKETRVKIKGMTDREMARYCLMGVRGIGQQIADRLLKGHTLAEVAMMDMDHLTELTTEKIAGKIWKVFHTK